jgi:hypothetical protein
LLRNLGGEDEAASVGAELGLEFEEGFVNRTEFFGFHGAPVHRDHAGFVREPREAVERLHEGAVAEAGGFQIRELAVGEESAESGQSEGFLAVGERAEHDLDALVAVVVTVPRRGTGAERAQGAERIALGVEFPRGGGGLGRMEEIAILRDHQEDEAIDEPEKLIEPTGERDVAGLQALGEVGIGFEEAGAKELESEFDLAGEAVAGGFAFFRPGIAPAFEITVGGRSIGEAEAGAVE